MVYVLFPYGPGNEVSVSAFADVKYVDVSGTSKGKGYAGVMKRHGFHGFPASHGTERTHIKGIEATIDLCLAYIIN